jgi:hypothetical protein
MYASQVIEGRESCQEQHVQGATRGGSGEEEAQKEEVAVALPFDSCVECGDAIPQHDGTRCPSCGRVCCERHKVNHECAGSPCFTLPSRGVVGGPE